MYAVFALTWIVMGLACAFIASTRGSNGCLWFGIGSLFGPFGLLLVFLIGRDCPNCQRTIAENALLCPYCKTEFERPDGVTVPRIKQAAQPQATKRCPFCAELILSDARKCRYCGEMLKTAEVTAQSPVHCEHCGHSVDLSLSPYFCVNCGHKIRR